MIVGPLCRLGTGDRSMSLLGTYKLGFPSRGPVFVLSQYVDLITEAVPRSFIDPAPVFEGHTVTWYKTSPATTGYN